MWMYRWVCESLAAPQASSSDAHLSAPLLQSEPSEPSAVYTLPLLRLAPFLFISLAHSHAHLFSLSLFLHSPSIFLQLPTVRLSFSRNLTLVCFPAWKTFIHLVLETDESLPFSFRLRPSQIQTVRISLRLRQALGVFTLLCHQTETGRQDEI